MSFETWLAFAVASFVIVTIPGPTVLMVLSYALGHGRRAAYSIVAGVALGDFTAMTASMLGLGALLATSAALFTAVKWIGAAYLVYLGIKLWRAPVESGEEIAAPPTWSRRRIFANAYVAAVLNPKGIVFYVAFFPQFLDPARSLPAQMAILVPTFVALGAWNALMYALLASAAKRIIRKASVQRTINRIGGALLIAAGALTVIWRRAPA
ncbi:MAG: LysE family translocator [Alphaproteobacteria bacterium]|nr:LysE family translocator [Alphaproteobacteria bacterium]